MRTYDDLISEIKEKIGDGREFASPSALAESCGLPPATISRYFGGQRGKGLEPFLKFLEGAGMLKNKKSPVMHRLGAYAPMEPVAGNDLVEISIMGVAGAGPAQDDCRIEPMDSIIIMQKYMLPGLFAFKIKGDSMEPTLIDGAVVGVAPPDGDLQEGAVYLVMIPYFGLVAKRLYFGQEGKLILKSDNKAVEPVYINAAEYEGIIKGKVAWVWQYLP